jgi:hypothetical protein
MSDIPFFISLNFCPPLLQELVHDQQMRTQMKDRLKKSQQATTSNPVPLLPGDRVLCRQTQYKSTTGHGKFQCSGGELQEFTVVSMSGGLTKLQDAVGHTRLVHESLLKVLPRVQPPTDEPEFLPSPAAKKQLAAVQTLGQFYLLPAQPDGACLFRSYAMGRQHVAGVAPHMITDNTQQALELRQQLCHYSELLVQGMTSEEQEKAKNLLVLELLDDPFWKEKGCEFSWPKYHEYLKESKTTAGHYCIMLFAKMERTCLKVWKKNKKGHPVLQWTEESEGSSCMNLLRSGAHFDLLVPV